MKNYETSDPSIWFLLTKNKLRKGNIFALYIEFKKKLQYVGDFDNTKMKCKLKKIRFYSLSDFG